MITDIRFYEKNHYLKFPKIVQIEITNRCPLKCPQCYKSPTPKQMSKKFFMDIVDECYEIGVGSIMLNGGEPILHSDVIEMIEYASQKNIITHCFLSGFGINPEIIKLLETTKVSISISLNGITKEINDLSRDGYEYAISAINLLKDSNINWGINWVARHDNIMDFNNLVDYAVSKKAKFINIIANKINGRELLSPMDYHDFILLKDFIEKNRRKIIIRVESCFSIMNVFMKTKRPALFKGCMAGIVACFIDVDGNYWPCSHLCYPERFNSIADYWEKSIYLKKLRAIDLKTSIYCRECNQNDDCRFCLAVSHRTSKNFNIGFANCPVAEKPFLTGEL